VESGGCYSTIFWGAYETKEFRAYILKFATGIQHFLYIATLVFHPSVAAAITIMRPMDGDLTRLRSLINFS
jgi:hypothetical protein